MVLSLVCRFTCAPAQISIEHSFALDVMLVEMEFAGFWVVRISDESIERHYNARRAKSTLRAMQLRDPLRQRMRIEDIADTLDGDDVLSINADQGEETGVDGEVFYLFCPFGDFGRAEDNGAGLAVH